MAAVRASGPRRPLQAPSAWLRRSWEGLDSLARWRLVPDRARSHPLLKSAISVRRLFQRGRQLCASDGGGSALGVKEQNCALGSESQCVTCLIVPY